MASSAKAPLSPIKAKSNDSPDPSPLRDRGAGIGGMRKASTSKGHLALAL